MESFRARSLSSGDVTLRLLTSLRAVFSVAAKVALVQMGVFPRVSAAMSAALLSRSWRAANVASRWDQRIPVFSTALLRGDRWWLDVAGRWPATSWEHYTTSCNTQPSAPEDGQNNCTKHVELIGIINKPLLLHLVGCLYYLYQ